jgi:O-methyltransferase
MSLARKVRSIIKDLSLKTGVYNHMFYVYPYMFTPKQLVFLTEYVKSVDKVPGCFVEAGCAYGATTVFLNKFMIGEGIERDYYAIDTFSGFVDEHAEHEIKSRGKPLSLTRNFTDNKRAWFDRSMIQHGVKRVKSIESDVTKFDFSAIAPIAFCLLDVDLYRPIKDVLPKIYGAMSPGGIIIVDDCKAAELWDGALQAYEEFIQQRGLPREIAAEKLGTIRGYGRDEDLSPPPAQIRTCDFPAYGSYLG